MIRTMKPGDTAQFAGYGVTLDSVMPLQGPNYIAERATITLTDDGRPRPFQETMSRFGATVDEQVAANLLRPYFFDGEPAQCSAMCSALKPWA